MILFLTLCVGLSYQEKENLLTPTRWTKTLKLCDLIQPQKVLISNLEKPNFSMSQQPRPHPQWAPPPSAGSEQEEHFWMHLAQEEKGVS